MKVRKKRCKECKELFTPKYSTTQIACSPSCAYAYSKRRQVEIKEENSVSLTKAFEEKSNESKLATLLKSVEKYCHEYIRLRDKYKPCISCDNQWNKDFQAGHYYKAELFSTIKFNELNINGQCRQCNLRKDGNFNEYNLRLPERVGREQFDEITYLAKLDKHNKTFKWDRQELIKLRNYYKLKIKQL